MNDDLDYHHTLEALRPAPPKAAAAAPRFACPYCERRPFDSDSPLFQHVHAEHQQRIDESGLRASPVLFRKLLLDEALRKAQTSRLVKPRPQLPEPIIAGSSIPDINPLHIEKKRSPTRKGEPPGLQRPSRKRAGEDEPPSRSPVRQHANTRRARGMGPEASSRQLPYHTSHKPSCDPQLNSPSPHAQPPSAMPERQPQLPSSQRKTPHNSPPTSGLPVPASSQTTTQQQPGFLQLPSDARWPDLVLQPDSRPISQEQLAAEVKSIYAGLTMVESKCIHVDKAQAAAERDPVTGQYPRLANDHWQALIALHRTLLHEHHDFFLASQHPSGSPALRRLAAKYSMPARMWKHGIHSFLELLRHRLPESLDYMLAFIYLAYQMMSLLYETVPAFEDTWIECLGDLGRYRMAIEDEDLRDRETWAGVARFWYSKAADKSPSVGRLYHHLAILARPNALQQLYYYSRSLACVQPFMSARESILTLFDPILGRTNTSYSHSAPVETSFIRCHGILFEKNDKAVFDSNLADFTQQLDSSIGRVTLKWKEQGAYMAIANIASLFDYGSESNLLRRAFGTQLQIKTKLEARDGEGEAPVQPVLPNLMQAPDDMSISLTSSTLALACQLTFDTLHIVLRRFGDKNVLTHFHILLAFLVQLSTLPQDTSSIFQYVAWEELSFFLNTLAKTESGTQIESASAGFLHEGQEDSRPLPEDYLIRGQLWAHAYFPANWFERGHDEEERMLEVASTIQSRTERVLWLGVRLAECNRGLHYDRETQTWSASIVQADEADESDDEMDIVEREDFADMPMAETPATEYDDSPEMKQLTAGGAASPTQAASHMFRPDITVVVCDANFLLKQPSTFAALLKDGQWNVVVPDTAIAELKDVQTDAASPDAPAAVQTLRILSSAPTGHPSLRILNATGADVTASATAALQRHPAPPTLATATAPAKPLPNPHREISILIGLTRQQSELSLRALHAADQAAASAQGVRSAVLVTEDRGTRLRAAAGGVAAVAASIVGRVVEAARKRRGSVGDSPAGGGGGRNSPGGGGAEVVG